MKYAQEDEKTQVGSGVGIAEFIEEDDNLESNLESWEKPLSKTWEDIAEDDSGNLDWAARRLREHRKRKKNLRVEDGSHVEKGMIRYVYLVVDASHAMVKRDFKPTRMIIVEKSVEIFIKEFFDQNPLSQLGIIISYSKIAEKVTDLGGNPAQQYRKFRARYDQILTASRGANNSFSLQESLEMAKRSLSQIPLYGSREILIVMGALSTNDAGDVFKTLEGLVQNKIRTSIISLSGSLYVCKQATQGTKGIYGVAKNVEHLQKLLAEQVPPQPIPQGAKLKRRWIEMGFPKQEQATCPSLNMDMDTFTYSGHICPRCGSKYSELPTECKVCRLTLISSPHLARSYHHLFPVPSFVERDAPEEPWTCNGCNQLFGVGNLMVECPSCKGMFCIWCDEFIHTATYNCPNCLSERGQ